MAGAVALVTLLVACAACGAVDVRASDVSSAQRRSCAALVAALPPTVADQERRETRGSPLGAAWGDPPIVLRCGVGTPADYDPTVGCQRVNGLDWFVPAAGMNDQHVDVVMTTYGRVPSVEVVLPAEYRPPAAAMVDLGPAIEQHTHVRKRCS